MKILVVFTGGTIASNMQNGFITPNEKNACALIDMYEKEKNAQNAEFDVINPYTLLSENLNEDYICKIVECVRAKIDFYDGIIVAHGTDTLQYTAAALSYALGNKSKCVVVVSSNYILTDPRANGYINFAAAADFILGGYGKGVFVSYANTGEQAYIHRASRLLPHEMYTDDVKSVKNSYFGKFENGVFVENENYTKIDDECETLKFDLNERRHTVIMKNVYPAMTYNEDLKDVYAVILNTYHSGTVATADERFQKFALSAHEKNIPLFLLGGADVTKYASAKEFENLHIKTLPCAAPAAMYVKLLFAPCGLDNVCEFMNKSLGEDIVKI